ncbi:Hsp20/alpha crystallin family protein [Sulfobacillus thermotolerans]|uniref:Hsp20/alpha crystallin family protein n=1 Tax=Sulfobacillus thermotolerans TaxID=338644 RepID=UPI0033690467
MRFEEWYGVNGVGFVPLTNIVRKDNAFEVDLAVPGYTEDQLADAKEGQDTDMYLRREIRQLPFRYRVELPEGAQADQIAAELHNGLLTVTIPLQPKKVIPVKIQTVPITKSIEA